MAGSPATPDSQPEFILEIDHLNKSFGGTKALNDVSMKVRRGSVHALLGGNGSGKSTAIKILASVYEADSGELAINTNSISLATYTPNEAQKHGLRFVHQDLGLFDELSIEENFALDAGYPTNFIGGVAWGKLRARVQRLLREYDLPLDPAMAVRELRPSDKTMVAIARALQDQEQTGELILVLDEPTARLAHAESELLLEQIRKRADRGQTIIIVSHRLREVMSVADDYTIFRDGVVVGSLTTAKPTEDELVEIMAGGLVKSLRPTGQESHAQDEPVLRVNSLVGGPLHGIDFTLHKGEILGLAGLVGSGRSSILRTIFGDFKPAAGTIEFTGDAHMPEDIQDAMNEGIGYIPEDRVHDAAFMDLSVSENIALGVIRELGKKKGWMSRRSERETAQQEIEEFKVKVAGPDALFSSMSGGNQQKVVLSRWIQRKPKLLLLDEPTQGVDVMSRADIYEIVRKTAEQGAAVLVASSDTAELHALCDRVLVVKDGQISDEVLAGHFDVDSLTRLILKESA